MSTRAAVGNLPRNDFNLVLFATVYSDADDAVHDLDGRDLLGGRIRVEVAKDPRDGRRERDRRRGGRDFG